MKIIGAGMAGLLCGQMLARHSPVIYEAQASLPNNHSAVLRFRSSIVGDVLGIPFKKVTMIKAVEPWRNPVADALQYSFKCTGQTKSDRSIITGTNVADRYIAPGDFISQMAKGLGIQCGVPWDPLLTIGDSVISTIPMPALMDILEYPNKPEFQSRPGINLSATVEDCDAYVSIYVPRPDAPWSRVSITGNKLIVEIPSEKYSRDPQTDVYNAAWTLGFTPEQAITRIDKIEIHSQKYAKILPIDDGLRKEFLHWATVKHNIYSIGRFACWRPGLLLDDLVQDIRKIEGWIKSGNNYEMARDR
jgi:hypothetical protein